MVGGAKSTGPEPPAGRVKQPETPVKGPVARETEPPPYGEPKAPAVPAATPAADGGSAMTDWHGFVRKLGLKGMAAQLADNSVFESWDGRQLALSVDPACSSLIGSLAERRLQEAVSAALGTSVALQLVAREAAEETPAQRDARDRRDRQQATETDIAGDPLVLAMQETFDAEIVPDSIRRRE